MIYQVLNIMYFNIILTGHFSIYGSNDAKISPSWFYYQEE